jgi:hypothetical protein
MAEAASNVATTRWGTPDPRDPGAYPAIAGTPMRQWAWEFLRRCPGYRVRWERKVRPFLDSRGDYDKAAIDRDHAECIERAKREGRGYRWLAPWSALEEEFKVSADTGNGTLDPRSDRPPLFAGESIKEIAFLPGNVRPPNHPQVILEFDLRLAIEPQLRNARYLLQDRQARYFPQARRNVKLPIAKFPLYLRALDFEELGTPDKEIGKQLFPHASSDRLRDTIRKTLAAARRWQDDYLTIILHSPADL